MSDASHDPAPPAPPAKSGLGALAVWVVAGVVTVVLGTGGGYVAGILAFPAKPAKVADAKEEPEDAAPAAPVPELRTIDAMLDEQRYEAALAACREYPKGGANLPVVAYRRGLALEGLGRSEEAGAAFREAVSRSTSEVQRAAGQLGLARVALKRGALDEGRELLCSLLARSAMPALNTRPFAVEARVQLALSLADELQPLGSVSARRPDDLARPELGANPDRFVGWDQSADRVPAWKPDGTLTITVAPAPAVGVLVKASLERTAVADLIERLAQAGGYALEWGEGARDQVLGRAVELATADADVSDVMLWLTLPHGLVYQTDGQRLVVRQAAKVSATVLVRYRTETAQQRLRDALQRAASHPDTGNLYLALGNLDAAAGQLVGAMAWYLRLGRDRPASPAAIPAMYNLGLLRLRQGAFASARDAFWQAIDRTPGHEMTSLCHWWIGRTHLDEGDAVGAQRPLLRALQPSSPQEVRTAAGLALVATFLYDNQPRQAWNTLQEQRRQVQGGPFLEMAAFLDGLARYQLADDAKKRATLLNDLMAPLLKPRDEKWLGPIGVYLRGQMLGKVGLRDEMVALFDQERRTLRGPLAEQMQFESADALARKGEGAQARARLEPLARDGSKRWASQASLRLAALDVRAGQPDVALERCRRLLEEEGSDRAAILRLMSQAYSDKKDYARASVCLEGKVPPP